jgi:glycosyltransferase involved in cell wall biosynthesis
LREVASRGLANINFPGAVPPYRLAVELAASDILVHPSICEGVPKVTQEAAACGLAQIVFGFYETPTVVCGTNGFVVWTDEELLDRMAQLLADADHRSNGPRGPAHGGSMVLGCRCAKVGSPDY